MNNDFIIHVKNYMPKTYPRPTRRYCKPILHEDNIEMPIITVACEGPEW